MTNQCLQIYVYYCLNSIDVNLLSDHFNKNQKDDFRLVSLPCSGKIDIPYLIKAFETGADGIVLITCPDGDCRSFEGNLRATKRSQAVESLLEEIGTEKGRMVVITVKDGHAIQAIQEIEDFISKIRKLPQLQKSTAKS
jgi:F420-non-reducing hydrogenase iron-sulfur subunit